MRPAPLGWAIVVGWALALVVYVVGVVSLRTGARRVAQAQAVIDSVAAKQCVLVTPGSEVRVFPPRRDTLKRAQP